MAELRTLDQSAKFHAMLRDISRQVKWAGLWLSEEDWKILVLGAKYGQTVGPNPFGHGLLIMNKVRSSKLAKSSKDPNVPNMNDLMNELQAFGDQEGVTWSDPNIPPLEAYSDKT